jgi:arylsulfatase A-like enzyme
MRWTGVRFPAWAVAIAVFFVAPAKADDAPSRPNIVLIYADDMAYGDLGANNAGAWVATPHLDALAASGVRFTNGYSAAPVCGPSRVALLTGAFPARYGAQWNPDTSKVQIPDERLLPAVLGSAGYTTAAIGKWNLPNDPKKSVEHVSDKMIWGGRYWPEADGRYIGVGSGWGAEGGDSGKWDASRPDHLYLTDKLTEEAVNFIGRHDRAKPFFLYLAYNAPHSPLEAAERFRDRVAHLDSEPKRLYAAMLLALDEGVGRVRKELAARGLDQNTIVIFASDNGPAKSGFEGYQPGWPKLTLGATGKLSGAKGTFREGGVREPFLISWPARIAPGQVNDEPVVTVDLYRTLADIAGATIPTSAVPVDGADLAPLMIASQMLPERDLYWAGRACKPGKGCIDSGAVRRGKWKLLIEDGGTPRLFDLSTDPAESRNLAAANPGVYGAMNDRYAAWRAALPPNAAGDAGKPTPAKKKPPQRGARRVRGDAP